MKAPLHLEKNLTTGFTPISPFTTFPPPIPFNAQPDPFSVTLTPDTTLVSAFELFILADKVSLHL